MSEQLKNTLYLPEPGRDDRDSSLVVYTVTIAIAIALFAAVINLKTSEALFTWLEPVVALFLALSIGCTFLSIEYLVDITSFSNSDSNTDPSRKKNKYKWVLTLYNISVIFILASVVGLLLNFLLPVIPCIFGEILVAVIILILLLFACIRWIRDIHYLWCKAIYEERPCNTRCGLD